VKRALGIATAALCVLLAKRIRYVNVGRTPDVYSEQISMARWRGVWVWELDEIFQYEIYFLFRGGRCEGSHIYRKYPCDPRMYEEYHRLPGNWEVAIGGSGSLA